MKKWRLCVIAAVILTAVLIGGITAYLNDSDTRTDAVTLSSNLDIQLLQPAWKGENMGNVRPRQKFDKDPRVLNRSAYDVYVFLEITQPYAQDLVAQDTAGTPINADNPGGALYSYTIKDGWMQLIEPTLSDDGTGHLRASYVYAWMKNGALMPLHPGETTGPLFTEVEVVNYTKATLGDRQDITVGAYALDAAMLQDTDPNTPRTPQSMWVLLRNTYPTPTPIPTATPDPSASPGISPSAGPSTSPSAEPSLLPAVVPSASAKAIGTTGSTTSNASAVSNAAPVTTTAAPAKTYPTIEWYPVPEEDSTGSANANN